MTCPKERALNFLAKNVSVRIRSTNCFSKKSLFGLIRTRRVMDVAEDRGSTSKVSQTRRRNTKKQQTRRIQSECERAV